MINQRKLKLDLNFSPNAGTFLSNIFTSCFWIWILLGVLSTTKTPYCFRTLFSVKKIVRIDKFLNSSSHSCESKRPRRSRPRQWSTEWLQLVCSPTLFSQLLVLWLLWASNLYTATVITCKLNWSADDSKQLVNSFSVSNEETIVIQINFAIKIFF